MLSCNRWLKTISAVRVSWPYLLVRILKYEIEAMKDRSNADGELYHGKVSTDARPAYFENDEVSKEHPNVESHSTDRGPMEKGTKYFSICALSPRDQRSGLNSSASSPQTAFNLWIVYGGQLTSVPAENVCPAIVKPVSGTTRGKPIPAVVCKRMASFMTSWRKGIFLTWSYVGMTASSFVRGDPRTLSSSF